uniref:Lipocalin n=1 Tax=Rhipicephalus zambeziensis TaxID=60191 RepID=A0A224YN92_9ACAR
MKYINKIMVNRIVAVFIFGLYCVVVTSHSPTVANLSLYEVFNTTKPLFMLEWKYESFVDSQCKGTLCTVQTGTCEHMRKVTLGKTIYAFVVSALTEHKTWTTGEDQGLAGGLITLRATMSLTCSSITLRSEDDTRNNMSFVGIFVPKLPAPNEMKVYRHQNPTPERPYWDWLLIYDDAPKYECSVFQITEVDEQDANTTRCALYTKEKLSSLTHLPHRCQYPFNNCSESRKVYVPYSRSCSVPEGK